MPQADLPEWVQVRHFTSWNRAKAALREYGRSWVFRGQQKARWGLHTSLERMPVKSPQSWEYELFLDFYRRAPALLQPNLMPTGSIHGWLGLMQHYGAPTRLIDFTRSAYVAAYFAFEHSNENDRMAGETPDSHAIWAIATGRLQDHFVRGLAAVWSPPTLEAAKDAVARNQEAVLRRLVGIKDAEGFPDQVKPMPMPGVLPVEPWIFEPRQAAQQSVFLVPGQADLPFMQNLAKALDRPSPHGGRPLAVKVVVRPSARSEALSDLMAMNVHGGVLFPGLDGLARQLRARVVDRRPK